MLIDELLAGVTPEHGIADDFIEAVRAAHQEGLDALAAEHATALEAATTALSAAHAAEIERVRGEKFEDVLDTDAGIDSVGDNSIDDLTFENYWTQEEV